MAIPWLLSLATFWDDLKPSTKLLWASVALVATLLIGALLIALVDRWRKRADSCEPLDTNDQLAHFRSLYEQGELSREEFERIRDRLGSRLRKELQATPTEAAASAAKDLGAELPRPPEPPVTGTPPA